MSTVSQHFEVAAPAEEGNAIPNHRMIAHNEFTFPGDVASVGPSREQVIQWIRKYGCNEADELDLTVALQEALANAALHGCGDDACKRIFCSVEIQPSSVSIVVRDPGPGFDFQKEADPKHFQATTLDHGRGIALMRGLVDEVTFARGGSEVRLSKHMDCRPTTTA